MSEQEKRLEQELNMTRRVRNSRNNRVQVKCYFINGDPNAKCSGYVTENFTDPQGSVTYFEEWFLLPRGFSPRRKKRTRIVEESQRAYTISMTNASPEMYMIGQRFFPEVG